jgi:uncharacterized membrane protein YoaK (UPF0700 family)
VTRAAARCAAALLLALAAGAVDAVSFITLHQTYTANMTGNSTELGIASGLTHTALVVPLVVAVVVFVVAIAAGTGLVEIATRRGHRSSVAPALILEALLLTAFMADGLHVIHHRTTADHSVSGFYVLLTVAVVAMGIQTACLTKALGSTVRTTFVSGLLTSFSQEVVNLLAPPPPGRPSYLRDELALGPRQQAVRRLAFHVGVWACFVAGATWGGYGVHRWSAYTLSVPIVAVVATAAVDVVRPIHRDPSPAAG